MSRTMELLDKALAKYENQRQLSRKLGLADTTITTARSRGQLSPTVAGLLAAEMGEDVLYWTALAGVESDKPSAGRDCAVNQLMSPD